MELRKKVKRPVRYEPEPLTRPDPTYAPRSTRQAFRIKSVDFNPALPPARFPTLKYPKVSEHSEHQTRSSGSDISSQGLEPVTSQQPWPDQTQEVLDVPYIATDGWEGKDDVRNQVPVGIIQQFDTSKGERKEEWSCEGLEISDDEGENGVKARLNAAPSWMSLPVPLQLTILNSMLTNVTLDTVFKRLRLTSREQHQILTQHSLRGRRGRMEDASIGTMHTEQLRLLTHNHNHGIDPISRSEFCKTFEDHLYKHINVEEDYHTITKRDLADAQIFLRRMGLDPDLAGEWSEIQDLYPAKESRSVAVHATVGQGGRTRLKLIVSLPSEVRQQPSAVTKHQTMALAKDHERSSATMPVKRVLFADKARGP